MKNLVISDISLPIDSFKNSIVVDLNLLDFSPCTGGFNCVTHGGICKNKDDMRLIADWANQCTLIVLVTKVKYGCVDIPMKRLLERCMTNYQSSYALVNGRTKHLNRSDLNKRILLIGYGHTTESERRLLRDYFNVDMFTNNVTTFATYFCEDEHELVEAIKTFGGVDHE